VRIPHVGWNEITIHNDNPLLYDVRPGTDFYFVHSYHVVPEKSENILATVDYNQNYVAVIGSNNIWGTQFHPEKSGKYGFQILKNFLQHNA